MILVDRQTDIFPIFFLVSFLVLIFVRLFYLRYLYISAFTLEHVLIYNSWEIWICMHAL